MSHWCLASKFNLKWYPPELPVSEMKYSNFISL
jgi:hypothetical protein